MINKLTDTFDINQEEIVIKLSPHGLWFRPLVVSEWFIALGIWEGYVRQEVRLSKGDIFQDVGAHIGYYSKTLLAMCRKMDWSFP